MKDGANLFTVDKRKVKNALNALGAQKKIQKGLDAPVIGDSYKQTIWNLIDTLQGADAYQMTYWLHHVDRWIAHKAGTIKTKYQRGEILFVEFGAMNFGFEPSFEHPAVVLSNNFNTILVAPGSSQTYSKRYDNIISVPTTDMRGLDKNTGFDAGAIRWISKDRVLDRLGHITAPHHLHQIEKYMTDRLDYHKDVMTQQEAYYENQIYDLSREKEALLEQHEQQALRILELERLLSKSTYGEDGNHKNVT